MKRLPRDGRCRGVSHREAGEVWCDMAAVTTARREIRNNAAEKVRRGGDYGRDAQGSYVGARFESPPLAARPTTHEERRDGRSSLSSVPQHDQLFR
jgi:hypothetical protein